MENKKCVVCGKEFADEDPKHTCCRECATAVEETRTCVECGAQFAITRGEKAFYLSMDKKNPTIQSPQMPKRCKACRQKRKKNSVNAPYIKKD